MTSVKLDWQSLCSVSQGRFFSFLLEAYTWPLTSSVEDAALPPGPSGAGPCWEMAFRCQGLSGCTGFLAPLLHSSVSFAFPCPFLFQESRWKPEVCRVQCHLFPLVRASGLTSLSFSFLSCELKTKNSHTHMSPFLVWMFYFCTHDQTIYYTILFITY